MYVKNFRAKSKLSEPKNRKKLARKRQKSVTATTDTINCKKCPFLDDIEDCFIYELKIKSLSESLLRYYRCIEYGYKSDDICTLWHNLVDFETNCKNDKIIKQCSKLRCLLNDYFALKGNKIKAYRLFKT